MKRSRVRLLFALVIVVFFTEFILALQVTEPFPAIIYPPFQDIPSLNTVIQKPRIFVFLPNQDSLEIDKDAFFSKMSNVYNNVILYENFNKKNSFQASLKEGRSVNFTAGTRKINLELEEVRDEAQIQEGKDWIAYTLKDILKRDDFTRLEVQWYDYKVSQNEEEPLRQGKLAEKYVVSFLH